MANINSRIAALKVYNQMSCNDSQLSKNLKKVASGIRINSASDDASGYSIAAKMHVLENSLGQDIENVKTGRNLIATAEGGIQEIISNLREMKEMAINAMNDHNSDSDRATIQKVYDRRMETITDIAATTNYNGRLLLNGDYYSPKYMNYWTAGSVTNLPSGVTMNTLIGLFPKTSNVLSPNKTAWGGWANGVNGHKTSSSSYTFDFSGATVNGVPASVPTDFDRQGFVMTCVNNGCPIYLSVTFDANQQIGTGQLTSNPENGNGNQGGRHEYVVGIGGATTTKDIERAIYEGIKSVTDNDSRFDGGKTNIATVGIKGTYGHGMKITYQGGNYTISQNYAMWFYDGTRNSSGSSSSTTIDPYNNLEDSGKPLIIHHGSKQNQHLRVYINSMHPIALRINGTSVNPRENAEVALDAVDEALEYSLSEITRLGAYQMQLEFTEDNLVTENENTTAAVSTIEDTDMAKGMMNYTKSSVLAQTAQSMLAQANQNMGSQLDLLK